MGWYSRIDTLFILVRFELILGQRNSQDVRFMLKSDDTVSWWGCMVVDKDERVTEWYIDLLLLVVL